MKNLTQSTFLCTLLFASHVFGADDIETPSLGCASRNAVLLTTLEGGVAGLTAYSGLYALTHGGFKGVTEHPYVASIFTVAGSVIAGVWQYNNVAESQFSYAKRELLKISEDNLFALILTVDESALIATIKDSFFREKLPLYVAFKRLNRISVLIDKCQESLDIVLGSERADLYQESNELQVLGQLYQNVLKDVFQQIKADPNFISECNAGTMEAMQEAQMMAAQAAQSSAMTQFMAYSNHPHCYASPNVGIQITG